MPAACGNRLVRDSCDRPREWRGQCAANRPAAAHGPPHFARAPWSSDRTSITMKRWRHSEPRSRSTLVTPRHTGSSPRRCGSTCCSVREPCSRTTTSGRHDPIFLARLPPPELAAAFQANLDKALALSAARVRANPAAADAHFQLGATYGFLATYRGTVEGRVLGAVAGSPCGTGSTSARWRWIPRAKTPG